MSAPMLRATLYASVLAFAAPALAGDPVPPGTLLGTTGNSTNELIIIDPATGAGTFQADIGSQGPVTEIEFRSDGTLFATTGQGSSNVITIDPVSGTETLIGMHAFGAVNGLEFIGNTLYGSYFDGGGAQGGPGGGYSLVTVNQTDGTLTTIGPLGYAPVRGLAYDPDTDTLYGAGQPVVPPNGNGGSDVLFTIDPANGNTTEIGSLGVSVGAIEFGPDGTLYGGQANSGGGGNGNAPQGLSAPLYTVDTATGMATAVGDTGFPAISGLSFVPGGGNGFEFTPVPTLGNVAIAILVLLVTGLGIAVIRRG